MKLCYVIITINNFQMGNEQPSKQSSEALHQRLGPVKFITSKMGQQEVITIEKTYPITNQREFDDWNKSIHKIKNTQTSQVLFLPIKNQYQKAGICGSSGTVTLVFQDYIFVLSNQIQNRRKISKPFLQTELWYLLYNMVRAAKEFQKIDDKVGDIQPFNIVINEDGQIKIICTRTRPGELNNFEKTVQNREEEVYLAPEECNDQYIKLAQYPRGISKTRAQVFSIGVTILEAATLANCNLLYKRTGEYQFNKAKLDEFKNQLVGSYSEHLVNLIFRMLDLNPTNRPAASQTYQFLHQYDYEILNLEPFQFPRSNIPYMNQSPSRQYSQGYQQHQYYPQTYQVAPSQYHDKYGPGNVVVRPQVQGYISSNVRRVQNQIPPISQISSNYAYQTKAYP